MSGLNEPILSVHHLSKRYGGIQALDSVSVDFLAGEIHALVGENGAGKSTLIKMISGAETPDEGEIVFVGKTYTRMTPQLAMSEGIATIYQEFNLFPSLSVAENIYMGDELLKQKKPVIFDNQKMEERAAAVLDSMKVNIGPMDVIESMSTAKMQLVEIAKAIAKNARILIMDEPTAPLSTKETEDLFALINRLKEKGVTIIYISHRMDELFRIADRITVLRDGKNILTTSKDEITRHELICHVANRKVEEIAFSRTGKMGDIVLEARQICGNGLKDITFQLHAGEIFGFGGLLGAGRTELARLLFGAEPIESGTLLLRGKDIRVGSPAKAVSYGIAYVPEDRKKHGAILPLPIKWNISLPILRRLSSRGIIRKRNEELVVEKQRSGLRIKAGSMQDPVSSLSGGNQQKVVLGKWIASMPEVLILDEPTRGVDVGAKQEIYNLIGELADQGVAIILISSDMDELLQITDRMLVLCEKRVAGRLEKDEYSQNRVLAMASGVL